MCKHSWQRHEDVHVCTKCGTTMTRDGKWLPDRRLPGALRQPKYRRGSSGKNRKHVGA